ncbi:DNA polymerase III subunit chi [Thiomicrospira sp. WB1]|uniref:DNA polymerase III subunit chi n=1 Tax=Thiomicrospira sp. WB1 TaxID=1685380 RepID=UPI0007497BC4|nr:DNA polymerase III subunit chi [Thiomicrospira sp. WB1]KUJ71760.1 hypothetical protein AVO41_04635 [Thiomicrospira sp. WB1]
MALAPTPANQDVLFYILPGDAPSDLDQFVLKLLNKIHRQGRQADLLLPDEATAQKFEERIWGLRPESFIPCSLNGDFKAPFQLYTQFPATPGNDVLINLNPAFEPMRAIEDGAYHRLIEILDQSPQRIELGRERWRQYKKLGLTPTSHKL